MDCCERVLVFSFSILGLVGCSLIAFMFAFIYCDVNRPIAPTLSIISIGVQNLDLSPPYYATGDWNFTLSVQNHNDFGWSYGFHASLLDSERSRSTRSSDGLLERTTVPALSQGGQNHTSFPVIFKSVSAPVSHRWKGKSAGGDSGFYGVLSAISHKWKGKSSDGDSGFYEVLLDLHLRGDIEPVPKRSLSMLLRWFISPLVVKCQDVKAKILVDSAGAAHLDDSYWSRHLCYSDFRLP